MVLNRRRCAAGLFAALLAVPTGAAPPPAAAAVAAEARLDPAFAEVQRWVDRGAFPGAVLAVGRGGRLLALRGFGRLSSAPGAPAMPADAIFDLASLTKVVATTSAAMLLVDQGRLDLDAPVVRYLPDFAGPPEHDRITVRELLTHSSGLAPAGPLWIDAHDRRAILRTIDAMRVAPAPGTGFAYRDENFILLGEIVRRLAGEPLDRFVRDRLFGPLGMRDTRFRPPASLRARIPPTEQDDRLRHTLVQGVVPDATS